MEIRKEPKGTEMVCHTKCMGPDSVALFHLHENYEFCQPLNCHCDFLVDGRLLRAAPGDIVAVESQVVHRFLPSREDSRIRVLQFPMRIVMPFPAVSLQTHIPKQAMDAIDGLFPAVTTLMELMEQEPRVLTGQKNDLFQSLMISLYLLLGKHFPATQAPGHRKDAALFSRAAEYANAHFCQENLTVERIAKALYISREKLSNLFAQYAGISCKQYIHTLRIDFVNQLLSEGVPITDAAMQAGFGSIRTFNSVYKSVTGMTPTEYRKQP
jgi:AraC-like DNA-binding protein